MCAPAEPAVRPKVLVVDDMALNRKLLTAVCRKLGYETVEAVNGAHAVEVFTREGSLVACILLDLEMPVLDGWQAAQKLRDLEGSLVSCRADVAAVAGMRGSGSIAAVVMEAQQRQQHGCTAPWAVHELQRCMLHT
eukprot:GHRR01011769.1.p1 GENE.GHRR01011769.1~~GHRR01011769.1.p1  ORF type:complete len:136 (+),score=51.64 GHRR01011769.1:560-967(+)